MNPEKGKAEGYLLIPSAYFIYKNCLINQCLLVRSNALAEHVVGPALIGEDDRDEDQGNNGHDGQCIL